MRFGVMAMQLPMLVPSGPPEQAVAQIRQFDHAGLVGKIHQHGFDLIELGGDLVLFMPHTYAPPAIEGLARLKAEAGISYTVHLPLWSVEPSTPLQPVREGSLKAILDCVRATQPLEPEVYVLHATGALAAEFTQMRLPAPAKNLIIRQFQQAAIQSLKAILAETGIASRRLAIETIEFPFELTLEMAELLDLSICLDVGHVLAGFSGPLDVFDVLETVLPRLGEVHLHDCPSYRRDGALGYGKDHQALGAGDLDTGRLLDRLQAAGWNGPIIFELTVAEALTSLDTVRSLRPALVG
ncbi:MAG: cobamide remodeling phosphodiesterase CbiR [Anaerolineaceae bacterium]